MPKFQKEFLQEALWGDYGGVETISDEITDNGRWSIHHYWVFKYQGRYFGTSYSVGATEYQDERAFEYDGDANGLVDVDEVEPYEKIVIDYRDLPTQSDEVFMMPEEINNG